MAVGKKEDKRTSAKVYGCLSFIVAAVLVVIGIVCVNVGSQIISTVNKSLVEQEIYFPPAGSPAFAASMFPDAQKYAGKQVDDGTKAKAYAQDYLDVQLKLVGKGKTSSEIAGMIAADPQNAMLQRQQATMFQLSTGKTLLLLGGYATSAQAMALKTVGTIALASAAVLLVVGCVQMMRYKRQ